mmetsp:Transcript_63970/g.146553  ORF Transcript_63970/g.146553 Transcript_63970/m.146553 type:complete len:279 (+) Transcript_63970:23-859(+)
MSLDGPLSDPSLAEPAEEAALASLLGLRPRRDIGVIHLVEGEVEEGGLARNGFDRRREVNQLRHLARLAEDSGLVALEARGQRRVGQLPQGIRGRPLGGGGLGGLGLGLEGGRQRLYAPHPGDALELVEPERVCRVLRTRLAHAGPRHLAQLLRAFDERECLWRLPLVEVRRREVQDPPGLEEQPARRLEFREGGVLRDAWQGCELLGILYDVLEHPDEVLGARGLAAGLAPREFLLQLPHEEEVAVAGAQQRGALHVRPQRLQPRRPPVVVPRFQEA